jgi:hypothetical protein
MKHSLTRLLRLRALLEDVRRVELEARLQELAQIEGAKTRSKNIGGAMRQQAFLGIVQAQLAERVEAQAVGEWVEREQGIFENARAKKANEVSDAKMVYLERRKEKRQVESVIEARISARAIEQTRREQHALDDWFAQRSRSNRRSERT